MCCIFINSSIYDYNLQTIPYTIRRLREDEQFWKPREPWCVLGILYFNKEFCIKLYHYIEPIPTSIKEPIEIKW